MAGGGSETNPLNALLARWRRPSVTVQSADRRLRTVDLDQELKALGHDGPVAKRLDGEVDQAMGSFVGLSSLTSPLAVDYLDRLTRPIPALTPEMGVQIVARAYVAHLVIEGDCESFGSPDVPVLGTLPPLKKGRPPQDILSRVVKASRRNFDLIRAVSTPVWDGFVLCLTKRAHDLAPHADGYVAADVVDGLARFGWVLRQVDIHYGLEPDRR